MCGVGGRGLPGGGSGARPGQAATARRGARGRGRQARRRDRGRSAVHRLYLAGAARQAGALPDPLGGWHARDARLPARPASGRTSRSPAPRGALVQLRRRERRRLLEQLRGAAAGRAGEDGPHPAPPCLERERRPWQGRARGWRRLADARRCDGARGANPIRIPGRARPAKHRASDRAPGGIAPGALRRQQGRPPRPARGSRARRAVRQGGAVHRRFWKANGGARAGQRRRQRCLHEQRGPRGRKGLGHARPLDGPLGPGGGRRRRAADGRPPEEPRPPHDWHARGYGLFAANPLGQAAFNGGKERLDFTLAAGAKATFRHLLLVLPGPFSRERAEQAAAGFVR